MYLAKVNIHTEIRIGFDESLNEWLIEYRILGSIAWNVLKYFESEDEAVRYFNDLLKKS